MSSRCDSCKKRVCICKRNKICIECGTIYFYGKRSNKLCPLCIIDANTRK